MDKPEIPLVAGEPDYLRALLWLCADDIADLFAVIRLWRRQAAPRDRLLPKHEIAARLVADTALLKRLLDRVREQAE